VDSLELGVALAARYADETVISKRRNKEDTLIFFDGSNDLRHDNPTSFNFSTREFSHLRRSTNSLLD
jgi:hypothetical protein